jgi:hypothetical protein
MHSDFRVVGTIRSSDACPPHVGMARASGGRMKIKHAFLLLCVVGCTAPSAETAAPGSAASADAPQALRGLWTHKKTGLVLEIYRTGFDIRQDGVSVANGSVEADEHQLLLTHKTRQHVQYYIDATKKRLVLAPLQPSGEVKGIVGEWTTEFNGGQLLWAPFEPSAPSTSVHIQLTLNNEGMRFELARRTDETVRLFGHFEIDGPRVTLSFDPTRAEGQAKPVERPHVTLLLLDGKVLVGENDFYEKP